MTFRHRIHKRSISPPFFPTKAHSAMPSSSPPSPISDNSSMTSLVSNANTDLVDLRERALAILELRTLASSQSHGAASQATMYIDPFCRVSQDDDEPLVRSRTSLLDTWDELARRYRNMQLDSQEAVVDEGQMKVWVSSELRGLEEDSTTGRKGKKVRIEVEMLRFDERGMLVEWSGSGRSVQMDEERD